MLKADLAHSTNKEGKQQTLLLHLARVAVRSKTFATRFGEGQAGRAAGLLHDIGKTKASWQERLAALTAGLHPSFDEVLHDHKMAGAAFALSKNLPEIALVVAGHHGGIPNLAELQGACGKHHGGMLEAETNLRHYLSKIHSKLSGLTRTDFYNIMMLFSCLCDADSIDTGEHFLARLDKPEQRTVAELFRSLSTHAVNPHSVADNVLKLRRDVRDACVAAISQPKGFFSLHAVTGSGKTLSGALFAFGHAAHHCMDRVIYVAPFRSIIDQTSAVYKSILGDSEVLAHHSSSDFWTTDEENALIQRQLAENWDIPSIVTTAEQFFESFYRSHPSASRKLHNVVNSVLIIDEVQALPLRVLTPCFAILKRLVREYRCSVLFTTATMPPLTHKKLLGSVPVTQVLAKTYRNPKRIRVFRKKFSNVHWFQVSEFMCQQKQALCIANTRKAAFTVYKGLPFKSRIYLSTWMYPAHRASVIEQVQQKLQRGDPLHLSSTQVIEAGVDFDFPDVMLRELAPLDSMMQAFGRCNRNGRGKGHCYIVSPVEGNRLQDYEDGIGIVKQLAFDQSMSVHSRSTMEKYYALLYDDRNLDVHRVMPQADALAFRDIREGADDNHAFRLILSDQIHLVVNHRNDQKLTEAIVAIKEAVKTKQPATKYKWAVRCLQPYLVSLYSSSFERLKETFPLAIEELVLKYYVWKGDYSDAVGLADVIDSLRTFRG